MRVEHLKIKMTFIEPVLGSQPGNPEVHSEFIAAKVTEFKGEPKKTVADSAEESEALNVGEEVGKATTIFPRDEKGWFLWDYQVRGALKENIAALIELNECKLSKWSYKRAIDQFVFITPRRIYLRDAKGAPIMKCTEFLERPLRASTMQGERIALARSEVLPEGVNFDVSFEMELPDAGPKKSIAQVDRELLMKCLDRGRRHGFGQWRGGGYGRFVWEDLAPPPAEAKK